MRGALGSIAMVVALSGCAPSMDADAPSPMDVPPGCCPIEFGAACHCGLRIGGSPGPFGCETPCDFFPSRMIVDSNGCPRWVDDDPCRLCMSDAGPSCDSGPR